MSAENTIVISIFVAFCLGCFLLMKIANRENKDQNNDLSKK